MAGVGFPLPPLAAGIPSDTEAAELPLTPMELTPDCEEQSGICLYHTGPLGLDGIASPHWLPWQSHAEGLSRQEAQHQLPGG